jgi:uncharacterized protein involved in exopolysaccharide biosynthesis
MHEIAAMQNTELNRLAPEQAEGHAMSSVSDPAANDFVEAASRLWKARGFIVKAVIAGAVASAILGLVLPKRYQSMTRLMPPQNRSSQAGALLAGAVPSALADAGASALGIQTPSALYEQVLESSTIEDRLIDKFDLRHEYHTTTYQDARERLTANTEIADDRKSGVITVMVTASSPQLAAGLARGYADALNEMMVQLDTSSAHREREFLETRLQGVEQELQSYTSQLGQFASKNTVVVGEEQNKALFSAVETLRGQAILAKADLTALKQAYSPENERVRAAQARLDELENQLGKMRGGGAKAESAPDGFPSIRELPLLGVNYAVLYRQMVVEEAVYEALTKQYEMSKVEEARDLPTVRVLDQANLPERKSWPKRTLLVGIGGFLAFLFSCAFVLMEDWWTKSNSPWRHFAGEVTGDMSSDLSGIRGWRKSKNKEPLTSSQAQ